MFTPSFNPLILFSLEKQRDDISTEDFYTYYRLLDPYYYFFKQIKKYRYFGWEHNKSEWIECKTEDLSYLFPSSE